MDMLGQGKVELIHVFDKGRSVHFGTQPAIFLGFLPDR